VPHPRGWRVGLGFSESSFPESWSMPCPSGLERYYGRGDLHFITFSCYRRLPFLGSSGARNLFVRELARVRREYGFLLLGYVVMPEHVHLLLSEPRRGTPSTVLQMLKQRVSHKMRKKRRSPAAGTASPELSRAARESAQLLASAVLRFQRKHKRENKRKTRVHTSQPDKPGTSRASQGEVSRSFEMTGPAAYLIVGR